MLRLGAGARVLVFDGRGTQYLARIATAAKDSVTLSLLEPVPPASRASRAADARAGRAQGGQDGRRGPRRDDDGRLGRDSVDHGAHGDPAIARCELGRVRERWHRIAVASAKQCGRAIVPDIGPPERLTDLFEAQDAPDVLRLQLIEPGATVHRDGRVRDRDRGGGSAG